MATTGQLIDTADKWLFEQEGSRSRNYTRNQLLMAMVSFHQHLLQQCHVMHSLPDFKARRLKLGLSLREVAKATGVSAATISRAEHGNEMELSNAQKLDRFYAGNGA